MDVLVLPAVNRFGIFQIPSFFGIFGLSILTRIDAPEVEYLYGTLGLHEFLEMPFKQSRPVKNLSYHLINTFVIVQHVDISLFSESFLILNIRSAPSFVERHLIRSGDDK